MTNGKRIAVIGGGISGLTAAYLLQKAGNDITLYESSSDLGGAIRTDSEDGWMTEAGPNTLMVSSREILSLISELGISDQMIEANPLANKRYVVRNGKPIPLPLNPQAFIASPLFSMKQKLRMLTEPFRGKSKNADESIADFVRRRIGKEFLTYAIDPFVSGVYAGDPEKLSSKYAFPKVYALEEKYGSLIKGQLRLRKDRKTDSSRMKPMMISFTDGLRTLIDALGNQLGNRIQRETTITNLIQTENGWQVCAETTELGTFDNVIITTPAHRAAALIINNQTPLVRLRTVEYPSVTSLALGFKRTDVKHPLDGFGMLIPSVEKRKILGVLFSSTLFPHRAPKDNVLLTVFIGGSRHQEYALLDDRDLISIAMNDLRPLLGITGTPVFIRRNTWHKAIPQYTIGFNSYLETIDTFERDHPGLHITSNYRGGISVPDCILNAIKLVSRL